jgi:hypothetical protein
VGFLLKFFLLTYALTWACFLAAVAMSHGAASSLPAPAAGRWLLLLLGTFAPSLVALGVTARENGIAATQALLHRMFEWRVGGAMVFVCYRLHGRNQTHRCTRASRHYRRVATLWR